MEIGHNVRIFISDLCREMENKKTRTLRKHYGHHVFCDSAGTSDSVFCFHTLQSVSPCVSVFASYLTYIFRLFTPPCCPFVLACPLLLVLVFKSYFSVSFPSIPINLLFCSVFFCHALDHLKYIFLLPLPVSCIMVFPAPLSVTFR